MDIVGMVTTTDGVIEIVLPSGQFARIRKPKWLDMVVIQAISQPVRFSAFIAQLTTLDDLQLTTNDILDMEARDVMPIAKIVQKIYNDIIESVNLSGGG